MANTNPVMPRERDEDSGKFTDAYGDDQFLQAIHDHDGLAGTAEIADAVDCTQRHALNRLRELEDRGDVESKKVGGSLIWMLPDN